MILLPAVDIRDGKAVRLVQGDFARETVYNDDLSEAEWAIEVSYEGSYELDEDTLKDGSVLDLHFGAMGGWIASTLVKLGDLKFEFLPPDPDEEE